MDAVTFTSSSTVKNFVAAFGADTPALAGVTLACIGPSTARQPASCPGREPDVIAEEHTIAGLVAAVTERYAPLSLDLLTRLLSRDRMHDIVNPRIAPIFQWYQCEKMAPRP